MPGGEYQYTRSLLALAACTPVTSMVHGGQLGEDCDPTAGVCLGEGVGRSPRYRIGQLHLQRYQGGVQSGVSSPEVQV